MNYKFLTTMFLLLATIICNAASAASLPSPAYPANIDVTAQYSSGQVTITAGGELSVRAENPQCNPFPDSESPQSNYSSHSSTASQTSPSNTVQITSGPFAGQTITVQVTGAGGTGNCQEAPLPRSYYGQRTWSTSSLAAGTYTVAGRVIDTYGSTASDSATFTIPASQPEPFTVRALVSGGGGSVSPTSQPSTGPSVNISVDADPDYRANSPTYFPSYCSTGAGGFTDSTRSTYRTGTIDDNCDFTFTFSQIVDGGWSDWSACSATACGTTGTQTRTCTNPTPANGGASCSGPLSQSCSAPACAVSMSGSLTSSSPSCTIPVNANTCNVTLTWSTTNPEVTPSKITSSYPSANYEVAVGNAGTRSVSVPLGGRTFFLYNNAKRLAQKNVDAACASGTVWNQGQNQCVATNQQASYPDLVASIPLPSTATINTPLTFSSNISNTGSVSTEVAFSNFFQITDAPDGEGNITNLTPVPTNALAANGFRSISSPSHTFASAGSYSVRACADKTGPASPGSVTESSENNNCSGWRNVAVTAPNTPNLTASSVTPTSATMNITQTFSATITNSGTASTSGAFSNFFQVATEPNGGGMIIELSASPAPMPMLPASDTNTATSSHTFTSSGTYYMRACADKTNAGSGGTVVESNENDNCGPWTTITVGAPLPSGPDLTASAPTPYNATVNVSQTFSANVSNIGTASTPLPPPASFPYFFQRASAPNGGGTITDLSGGAISNPFAAGASSAVSKAHTFSSAGGYSIRVCADKSDSDSSGSIAESNENNNCSSWTNITVSEPFEQGTGTGDGGWSAWSACSVTCGGGYQERTCTNPAPAGGADCSLLDGGNSIQACNMAACPGTAPMSGICHPSHYFCQQGISGGNQNGTNSWTWICSGWNGGANASCSELKKRPTFIED